jgi:biopolymer transport protein ExbD
MPGVLMQATNLAFQGRKKLSRTLDMTPLIDVVFQLLLFFMLTSAIVVNQGLELNLPEAASTMSLPSKPLQIEISSEQTIHIDGKQTSLESLQDYLAMTIQNPAESQVVIRSDAEVPVSTLVSVMDTITSSGIHSISIAAKPGDTKSQ